MMATGVRIRLAVAAPRPRKRAASVNAKGAGTHISANRMSGATRSHGASNGSIANTATDTNAAVSAAKLLVSAGLERSSSAQYRRVRTRYVTGPLTVRYAQLLPSHQCR